MFAGLPKDRRQLTPNLLDIAPIGFGNANPGVGRVESGLRKDDDTIGDEARQDGSGQVLPNLIQAQAASLALGISTIGAHGREVIVTVDDGGLIEVGAAIGVGGDDERVQGKRHRTVAVLGVLNQLTTSFRQIHVAHGRRTPGTGRVGVRGGVRLVPGRVFVRVRVVSFEGSM